VGDVVKFGGETRLDIDPNDVLEGAKDKLQNVIVIGWEDDKEGSFWFASSQASGPEVIWLLELAKQRLLDV